MERHTSHWPMCRPRFAFTLASALLFARPPRVGAFIEELFGQAFGGGGGGGQQFHFQMGDGGMFEMGGGGPPRRPKWPKGVPKTVSKQMSWMKGTEWSWNGARNVQFGKDGDFEAPTQECQMGGCKWSAEAGKVYILWGDKGLYELDLVGRQPKDQSPSQMQGLRMRGRRKADGAACDAVFQRVFDHEAAALDKDLYEILGLPDDADEAAIKKVYKKLAVKYHPDKNPDEESRRMFSEIRDAYEILNDPDKKILYDTGGMEAVKNAEKGEVKKGDDVHSSLDVSLEDLYNSGVQQASYERRVVCRGCSKRPDSPKCRGCGRCPNELKTVNVQVGPGMFMQQQQEVRSKEKCRQEEAMIDVTVEKGMRDGESLTFPRMAEQTPGMLPGGVVLMLKVAKHSKFERRGDDLHMAMDVSLREALLGWSQSITHMDGHRVELGTTSVTKPLQVIRVKGEGMPLRDDPASFGDLYVKVQVLFPDALTSAQQDQTAKIFEQVPPRAEL